MPVELTDPRFTEAIDAMRQWEQNQSPMNALRVQNAKHDATIAMREAGGAVSDAPVYSLTLEVVWQCASQIVLALDKMCTRINSFYQGGIYPPTKAVEWESIVALAHAEPTPNPLRGSAYPLNAKLDAIEVARQIVAIAES